MCSQIRRATLSVHLNITEGASRKSEVERKRYFEISRGSLVEIDAAQLKYLAGYNMQGLDSSMVNCFKIITGLIKATSKAQN